MRTHTEKILLVLGAAVVAAIPAFGQKQTPPAGGAPKAFTLPAHETYTLTNGMKVTLVPLRKHSEGEREPCSARGDAE